MENGGDFPRNVLEYTAVLTRLPGGKVISGGSIAFKRAICSIYAAPFFALSNLAPEILQKTETSVVLGGNVRQLAIDGGRWLTLFSRIFQLQCKFSFSICAPGKSEPSIGCKEILFHPAQRVLNRKWSEHLAQSTDLPDVLIIYALHQFDDIWAAMSERLAEITQRSVVLWSGASEAELTIVRAMLRSRNFDVSEPLPFCETADNPQDLANGAWWVRVGIESPELIRQVSHDERESFSSCLATFRNILGTANSAERAGQIAATYGSVARRTVEDESLEVILLTPTKGIDLASGRVFDDGEGGDPCWTGDLIAPEVMALVPKHDTKRTESANSYRLMSWINHAMTKGVQAKSSAAPATEAEIHVVVEPDYAKSEEAAEAAIPVSRQVESQPAPALFRKRARLSRSAGITDVLAIAARLGATGTGGAMAFESSRQKIVRWLTNKGFVFEEATGSVAIETTDGEVSLEANGDSLWSMRFDDRTQMAAGAFWRVELTIIGGQQPAIGLRVAQVRQKETAPPPIPGVPRVVAEIAAEIGLHEGGFQLRHTSWFPAGKREEERLMALLCDPMRMQPVIVVSTKEGLNHEPSIDRLAARLTGVAHLVLIDHHVSDTMIQRFGKNMAVYGNAVRLYQPGFNSESDPFNHPVWATNGLPLPLRITNEIAEEACVVGVQSDDLEERVPSFQSVRRLIADGRVERALQRTLKLASSAQEERDRQQAVRDELETLLRTYKESSKELAESNRQLVGEREALLRERDMALDEVRRLKYQASMHWQPTDGDADISNSEDDRYPDSWDDLETWVECFGNDRLELLPQATKAARESPFLDIQFAYRALEFLVEYYVPLRTRSQDDEETRLQYEEALAKLGIEVSLVGTAVDDKRYKQEYRRKYQNKTIKLDMHLKRGVGFDGSTLFRLYFWYDEESSKVVVGHLPTHLTNRITHAG
jgi:hypothetical protein